MVNVTVPGTKHTTVTLAYDRGTNADLARQIAGAISAGLADKTIVAANGEAAIPPLNKGQTGELVLTRSDTTFVPKGYDYVVDAAEHAVVFGNGDANQQVLVGRGNLTFNATGGSGSIIGGGGQNVVRIAPADAGNWMITMGNGNDVISAFGHGNDTISAGSGKDRIDLGSGNTLVTSTGRDTIYASHGTETIEASGKRATDVIYGDASRLFFVAGGAATVIGGTGSDTVYGGTGNLKVEGGSAGSNFLQAGSGRAELFAGGDGDQLYAAGTKAQELHAASGSETLFGGFASGRDTFYGGSGADQIFGGAGHNTFVAGKGAATVTANASAENLFEFVKGKTGGSELVEGLTAASQVHIKLLGFGPDAIKNAVADQTATDNSVTITLTDNTAVTFQNITHLTRANFSDLAPSGFARGDDFHDRDHHDRDHHDRDHQWVDHGKH